MYVPKGFKVQKEWQIKMYLKYERVVCFQKAEQEIQMIQIVSRILIFMADVSLS